MDWQGEKGTVLTVWGSVDRMLVDWWLFLRWLWWIDKVFLMTVS